jgi:hypothetical protein
LDVFDRAAAGGATLLRVERIPAAHENTAAAFVLTFDVGFVLVQTDAATGILEAVHLEDRTEFENELLDASEEEPWWRLLGCPLAKSQPASDASFVRLQFTIADARPRTLRLASSAGGVHPTIEAGD